MEHVNILYLQNDKDYKYRLSECAIFLNPLKHAASDMIGNMVILDNSKYNQIIQKRWTI